MKSRERLTLAIKRAFFRTHKRSILWHLLCRDTCFDSYSSGPYWAPRHNKAREAYFTKCVLKNISTHTSGLYQHVRHFRRDICNRWYSSMSGNIGCADFCVWKRIAIPGTPYWWRKRRFGEKRFAMSSSFSMDQGKLSHIRSKLVKEGIWLGTLSKGSSHPSHSLAAIYVCQRIPARTRNIGFVPCSSSCVRGDNERHRSSTKFQSRVRSWPSHLRHILVTRRSPMRPCTVLEESWIAEQLGRAKRKKERRLSGINHVGVIMGQWCVCSVCTSHDTPHAGEWDDDGRRYNG